MNFSELARDYLRRSEDRRSAIETLREAGAHADIVRECQEVTELLLKGALRYVGIDPPKRHDVGPALARHIDRFPEPWRAALDHIVSRSARLVELRGLAFYGDEGGGRPASELFSESDAQEALAGLDELLELYRQLLAAEGDP